MRRCTGNRKGNKIRKREMRFYELCPLREALTEAQRQEGENRDAKSRGVHLPLLFACYRKRDLSVMESAQNIVWFPPEAGSGTKDRVSMLFFIFAEESRNTFVEIFSLISHGGNDIAWGFLLRLLRENTPAHAVGVDYVDHQRAIEAGAEGEENLAAFAHCGGGFFHESGIFFFKVQDKLHGVAGKVRFLIIEGTVSYGENLTVNIQLTVHHGALRRSDKIQHLGVESPLVELDGGVCIRYVALKHSAYHEFVLS